ncbi:MAG: hypothetical protein P8J01_03500 [Acidimicrobiales bacterium]|nr:hypothetical protein [Acidimicrobiales bacterium]
MKETYQEPHVVIYTNVDLARFETDFDLTIGDTKYDVKGLAQEIIHSLTEFRIGKPT